MEPMIAMQAAADAAPGLRVLSLVLGNDYRHPVLVHKMAATMDVLSAGRVELGLGAGWMSADYSAAGIIMPPAGVRVERLSESVRIIKALFGDDAVTLKGSHYNISNLIGLPKPVQKPRPPLLIGGGGRRILGLAAREADIVGVYCSLPNGVADQRAVDDLRADRMAAKVAWVRAEAEAAGRDPRNIELQLSVLHCCVLSGTEPTKRSSATFSSMIEAAGEVLQDSPAVLVGDVHQCVDLLQERREKYGFSYLHLGADAAAVEPIVARLAGT